MGIDGLCFSIGSFVSIFVHLASLVVLALGKKPQNTKGKRVDETETRATWVCLLIRAS